MARPPSFIGTGWGFPPGFDDRQLGALMVDHAQDIEESLHILLSTRPGERAMHPAYGCDLRRMVFEQMDTGTLAEIRDLVERAVRVHEPRIVLHEVQTGTEGLVEGVLRLQLVYTIRRSNDRRNWVYPFYLGESGARS
ncbi:GPW/gp25 family protein [Rhizobacter sp. P5_C2]